MFLEEFIKQHKTLTNNDYSNFDHSKDMSRHRWYYFKEGFSPLIVEEAIKTADLEKDDLIIDPFSGSGTVPLVASTLGYDSIGFEVNPFMAFIAKAKQTELQSGRFVCHKETVLNGIRKGHKSNLEKFSTFTQSIDKAKWLFNTDVVRSFEGGWRVAEKLPQEARRLYKLNLISSAMNNSNAVKDGKCLRYKKDWKQANYNRETYEKDFINGFDIIKEDIEKHKINKKGNLVVGDVREKISHYYRKKFKLCVTSPPYLNSFDYSDIYRPELFLAKFVHNNIELNKIRLKTIRSHVQTNWNEPVKEDFGILYKDCIDEVSKRKDSLWNIRIPSMIQAYFEDMDKVLTELKCIAKKDASLWIVVSTSAYAGVEIPVDLILADIGSRIGWQLKEIIVTRYLRHSTQNAILTNGNPEISKRLRESIIIFKGMR
jgi:DNA modification methylase